MEICECSFDIVKDHLETLDYDGPLALSCDNTKLFATFRLYWDSQEENYFLVGGVNGKILVANPDQVRETLAIAKAEKATKVTFPSLNIPKSTLTMSSGPTMVPKHPCS
jgi:hypothetical protein